MTELVATQPGFALFRVSNKAVVVNTAELNASDPEPMVAALKRPGWSSPEKGFKVPPVWVELASTAASSSPDVTAQSTATGDRTVRVPKRVVASAASGLRVAGLAHDEVAARAARKLASGAVPLSTVKRVHYFFTRVDDTLEKARADGALTAAGAQWLLWGGDEAREWAAKTVVSALTAAGDLPMDPELPDPSEPHDFEPSVDDPNVCVICNLAEDDELHMPVAVDSVGSSDEPAFFGIFDPEFNGPAFRVTTVFAKNSDDEWFVRENGEWTPADEPENVAELSVLDEEQLLASVSQLDKPGATHAEFEIDEVSVFGYAADEIDYDRLEAVFRLAPYVPPQVRSANAAKQKRDKNGRFFKPGATINTPDGHGKVENIDDEGNVKVKMDDGRTQTVKTEDVEVDSGTSTAPEADAPASTPASGAARLDSPRPLVPNLAEMLEQYLDKALKQLGGGVQASATLNVDLSAQLAALRARVKGELADADPALVPPPEDEEPVSVDKPASPAADAAPVDDAPATSSDFTPENSPVEPLFLAVVDKEDTQAVMDLIAVVPKSESGTELSTFVRKDGAWVASPEMLADLQGATPPPVVELDKATLENVMAQMEDGADTAAADAPAAEPVAAAGMMLRHTLTASGGILIEQVPAPAQFAPYDEVGFAPDIVKALDELAEGGADRNRGNAERLRRYWVRGEGAAKIGWGTDGDWTRCVSLLSEHMGARAKGYCTLRHKDALGYYPGELDRPGNPTSEEYARKRRGFAVEELSVQELADAVAPSAMDPTQPHVFVVGEQEGVCAVCSLPEADAIHVTEDAPVAEAAAAPGLAEEAGVDPTKPHEFNGPGPESDFFDGECGYCGKGIEDPIHTVTAAINPPGTSPDEPHEYEELDDPIGDGGCELCGKPYNDDIHKPITIQASGEGEFDVDTPAEVTPGQRFRIPLVVPEGVSSGDGRTFADGALSSRPMPLALMWQPEGDEGHKGSVIVGRIDHVERLVTSEGGYSGLGNAYGVFDTSPVAQEALRLVQNGMLRGISADLDEFEADVLSDDGQSEGKITSTKLMVNSGRLMGVTLVAKPAFAECTIELLNEGETVADGEYMAEDGEARVAALLASAAPVTPPKAWFEDPKLDKPTHLTVDDEGRVYGHIAAWDVDHIGLPFGTRAPRSASNYAYFRTGVIRTAEGEDVPVGQLTLSGGHAPLQADARAAVKHYDDTGSAWADVAAGEDKFGIWVSGALRPSVTPEQIRVARASSPSGDWRPIKGKLELVAACCVNVPGFPVARAMVAGGMVTSLVAAGAMTLERQAPATQDDATTLSMRIEALEAAERERMHAQMLALKQRISPAAAERQEALTAAATAAKERVAARRAELAAQKEQLVARVASLRYMPEFDEEKHPRDSKGRFRRTLARIADAISGGSGPAGPGQDAEEAIGKLGDAADAEDAGDNETADRLAEEASDQLERAADAAESGLADALATAAGEIRNALARLDEAPGGDDGLPFADLPEAVQDLLQDVVDRMEQQVNPADPDELFQKAKAFITGTNFLSPSEIANLIARNLKQQVNPSNQAPRPEEAVAPVKPQPTI